MFRFWMGWMGQLDCCCFGFCCMSVGGCFGSLLIDWYA